MRLFLDQMLRTDLAERLKTQDHDVLRVSETGDARADDSDVLARAVAEERTLVTLDEFSGEGGDETASAKVRFECSRS